MSKFRVKQDGGHVVLKVRKGGVDRVIDRMTPSQAAYLARELADKGKAALTATTNNGGTEHEAGLEDN